MSSLRLSAAARARRFHRYLTCKTCGAQPGMPCLRMPVPQNKPTSHMRHTNENPHQGRERTKERCGRFSERLTDCNLPPDHGGDWHYNRQGRRWK